MVETECFLFIPNKIQLKWKMGGLEKLVYHRNHNLRWLQEQAGSHPSAVTDLEEGGEHGLELGERTRGEERPGLVAPSL